MRERESNNRDRKDFCFFSTIIVGVRIYSNEGHVNYRYVFNLK